MSELIGAGLLRRYVSPLRRRRLWRSRLPEEVAFWDTWLRDRGEPHYGWDYDARVDPASPLDEPIVVGLLDRVASRTVAILDVGAGPLTSLGKVSPGRTLEITPVDPLAKDYDVLLARHGIEAPVPTLPCQGERLNKRLGTERFDIAYARNSLDHGVDPPGIIESMVRAVKPGGFVVLRHLANEGEGEYYVGLHQWNFDADGSDLVVWNERERTSMSARLAGRAAVRAEREDVWVNTVIERLPSPPSRRRK
jgi:SAM-dependent methyltransferase